jgi:RNA polymerase sigma-70 factor (ECF subfamily)
MVKSDDAGLLELLEKIGQDDEAAFAALIERTGPRLLRFALKMLEADRGAAEDLVQETFLRVWQARHRWQPEASTEAVAESYFFTIASRLCLNRRRLLSRRPAETPLPGVETDAASEMVDNGGSPLDRLTDRRFRGAITEALAELPPQQRAALLLRAMEGLRYQEIAAILDTSPGAVESLLVRARNRLRERLSRWLGAGKPGERCSKE